MDDLVLKVFEIGILSTNAYLLYDKITKKAFIVDLPSPSKSVLDFIKKNDIKIEFVLLTHAHWDHIGGLNEVDWPFYVHNEDKELLTSAELNGAFMIRLPFVIEREGIVYKDKVKFIDYNIDVIHIPGHTPGGVCLKIGDWLFSGDTLFRSSVGRTDLYKGSQTQILSAIRNKLFVLDDNVRVFPGHGPDTTIGDERNNNPFF